jgi:hypothetical protein
MSPLAERTFDLAIPSSPSPSVVRLVIAPPVPAGDAWIVHYALHGPDEGEVRVAAARGVDALHALRVALWVLPFELDRYRARGHLTWAGSEDLGLEFPPVP